MAKYTLLVEYLRRVSDDQVDMTFAQIEQIIGDTLPKSARIYPPWWANESGESRHVQASAWISEGWNATPNLERKTVRFIRKR